VSDDLPTSHKGKIGSLPAHLREEVNRRLHDGQTAREICDWLNAEPRVLEILDQRWNEQPITAQNLSEWRAGGYKIWLKSRERSENLRALSEWAADFTERVSPVKLAKGAQAIVAGRLLEVLEESEEDQSLALTEILDQITKSVDRTAKNEIARDKLDLQKDQHALREQEYALAREKFEVQTVEQFLKWQGTKEAQAIVESGKPKEVQTQDLLRLFFGRAMDAPADGEEGHE
jgi:hypothetical protein